MSKYKTIDLSQIKTGSIQSRPSKVDPAMLAEPVSAGDSMGTFFKCLPDILKAADLKNLARDWIQAKKNGKPVIVMMGAHVIKTGLNPVLIDLMESGWIQALAMNGAGAIHDVELAYFGKTSEDVAVALKDGSFGMARETGELLNGSLEDARNRKQGFGEVLGHRVSQDNPSHSGFSLLGRAYDLDIPVTVHVALGTDIVHQHPSADGALIGEASLRDFRILCEQVAGLNDGGLLLLLGSAVLLPEVFLKALTVARNVHGRVENFTTAAFDMIRQYRPQVNVTERPVMNGGRGFMFTGHHEIMIPLLAAVVKEAELESRMSV